MAANGPSLEKIWTSTAAMHSQPLRAFAVLLLVLFSGLWFGIGSAGSETVRAAGHGNMSSAENSSRILTLAARDAMRAMLSSERNREPPAGGVKVGPGLLPSGIVLPGQTWSLSAVLTQGSQASVRDHQSTGFRPRGPPPRFA